MATPLELYVRLFRGHGDARGSWTGPAIREPVTPEHFQAHLSSSCENQWFGVYNVIGDRCSWGCVDIDVDDLALAQNILQALQARDVVGWIEQTTRGYHVWVFPADPLVQAATMRRALTAACLAVGYSPKEVFPKQAKVSAEGLGNFVRLPYNGYWSDGEHVPRMMVAHTPDGLTFETLLEAMNTCRTPTAVLEKLAATLPEPTRSVVVDYDAGGDVEDVVTRLGGLAYVIWRDGPLPGSDRSTTMVHLARLCARQELPAAATYAVVASADVRWGKDFLERGEAGRVLIERIIDKAYS